MLVGLDGLHVIGVDRDDGGALVVTVESGPTVMGAPVAGSSRKATAGSWGPGPSPGDGPTGADPLAEAAVGVPRPWVPGPDVGGAGRAHRSAALRRGRGGRAGGRSSRSAASTPR